MSRKTAVARISFLVSLALILVAGSAMSAFLSGGLANAVGSQTGSQVLTAVGPEWQPLVSGDIVEYNSTYSKFRDADGKSTDGQLTLRTLQSRVSSSYPIGRKDYSDWALSRRCSNFRVLIGLDDSASNSEASVQVRILADGAVVWDKSLRMAQHYSVNVPLNNPVRMRVETTQLGSATAYVNLGDASVHCGPIPAEPLPPTEGHGWKPALSGDIVEYNSSYSKFREAEGQLTDGRFTSRTLQSRVSSSYAIGRKDYSDWALNRECSHLRALIGLDDSTSNSEASVQVRILADGAVVWDKRLRLAQHYLVNVPLNKPVRLRVETTQLGSTTAYVNLGNPSVFCGLPPVAKPTPPVVAPKPPVVAPKPPVAQQVSVKARAVKRRSKLRVNVNPDQSAWNYRIKIQKKIRGKWRTVRITRTKGAKDVRTVNLRKGKYRVKVPSQHGYQGNRSGVVRLRR